MTSRGKKKKLVYVLGHGYSGSTLFNMALGSLPRVLALGEVVNLEHEYNSILPCSCPNYLKDCPFWQKVIAQLAPLQKDLLPKEQFRLAVQSQREAFDARSGGLKKLLMVLGIPLTWLFSKKELDRYRLKNSRFMENILSITHNTVVVDVSKSPERLKLLLLNTQLEVYCIYLKRSPFEVFASNLKRPKTTRAKYGFKVWREAIWYALRTRSYNRVYKKIDPSKRRELDWHAFTKEPCRNLNDIAQWLGLKDPNLKGDLLIKPAEQHLYVGNRWLHWERPKEVVIKENMSNKKLMPKEETIFRKVLYLFNLKKELGEVL